MVKINEDNGVPKVPPAEPGDTGTKGPKKIGEREKPIEVPPAGPGETKEHKI